MGELLTVRLAGGAWKRPIGLPCKVVDWGLLGVAFTFMFGFYATGVSALTAKSAPLKLPGA